MVATRFVLSGLLGLTFLYDFVKTCEIGEEKWRVACSHLSAYASWGKINREESHNSCHYGSPDDWIIIENRVNVQTQRGEVDASVDVVNEDVESNIMVRCNSLQNKAFDVKRFLIAEFSCQFRMHCVNYNIFRVNRLVCQNNMPTAT